MEKNAFEVVVSEPICHTEYSGARQYFAYKVRGGNSESKFEIERRYHEFEYLSLVMRNRWPGCIVPSLPGKNRVVPTTLDLAVIRSRYIQYFVRDLHAAPYLWYSHEAQLFFQDTTVNCEKILKHLSIKDPAEIISRYSKLFGEVGKGSPERVAQFNDDIKVKLSKSLHELKAHIEKLEDVQKGFKRNYGNFFGGLKSYEERVMETYHAQKQITSHSSKGRISVVEEQLSNNPFFELLCAVRFEVKAVAAAESSLEAYYRLVHEKEKLEQRIKEQEIRKNEVEGGKESLLAKVKGVPRDKQIGEIVEYILALKKELEETNVIVAYCLALLTGPEYSRFTTTHVGNYYRIIREVSKSELDIAQGEQLFWTALAKENAELYSIKSENISPAPNLTRTFPQPHTSPRKILTETVALNDEIIIQKHKREEHLSENGNNANKFEIEESLVHKFKDKENDFEGESTEASNFRGENTLHSKSNSEPLALHSRLENNRISNTEIKEVQEFEERISKPIEEEPQWNEFPIEEDPNSEDEKDKE